MLIIFLCFCGMFRLSAKYLPYDFTTHLHK